MTTLSVEETALDGVRIAHPRVNRDDRGVFVETYNRVAWAAEGIDDVWVQDNTSVSIEPYTLRGLHFQVPPRPVAKLVRVVHGAIVDVVVDLRVGSPTYGEHLMIELEPDYAHIYVPIGFAHGFCTLEPNTEVAYKVTDHWAVEVDRGLAWDDPELGIAWPTDQPILSDKDAAQPRLAQLPALFWYAESA